MVPIAFALPGLMHVGIKLLDRLQPLAMHEVASVIEFGELIKERLHIATGNVSPFAFADNGRSIAANQLRSAAQHGKLMPFNVDLDCTDAPLLVGKVGVERCYA